MLQNESRRRWRQCIAVVLAAILAWIAAAPAFCEVRIDSASELDPKIDPPAIVHRFSPRLMPLWLEALERPEADMQRQAADAIAAAHRKGMPGLAETVPALLKALEKQEHNPVVRLSAAKALIDLDARQTASALWKAANEGGIEMAQLVEPALGRWRHLPVLKAWIDRLEAPDTRHVLLVLAIEGVGATGEPRALPRLRSLVRDLDTPPDLRSKAATAMGRIRTEGLESDAEGLMTDRSAAGVFRRLAAAKLLAQHRGDAAQKLLLNLAGDPEPAVAAVALRRLLEIDPMLVKVPMLRTLIAGPDANVRRLAAEFLVRHRTPETVAILGPALDDEHPDVRGYVRDSFAELVKIPELDTPVRQAAVQMLATDRPRGLEQAAMVLGAVDHKAAAPRLLELLDFHLPPEPPPVRPPEGRPRRPGLGPPTRVPPPAPILFHAAGNRVNIASAWALRRLAVPATAEGIARALGHAMDWTKAVNDGKFSGIAPPLRPTYDMAEQLIEALGVLRYRPFDARLREFLPLVPRMFPVPRMSLVMQDRSRGRAVWALGQIHADDPEKALTEKLIERVEALTAGEDPFVSRMAVVSLGRMKAQPAVSLLRRLAADANVESVLADACVWSLRRTTGERIADPIRKSPVFDHSSNWFLVPIY